MTGLIDELVVSALNPDEPVDSLVRKAFVAATRLNVPELRKWAEFELNGYGGATAKDVPQYRKVRGELRAWDEALGDWKPVFDLNDKSLYSLEYPIVHPIGSVASNSKLDAVVISFEGDHKKMMMKALSGPAARVGVLVRGDRLRDVADRVRNIALTWALDLEQAGVQGEGRSFTSSEKDRAAAAGPQITNHIRNTFENIENVVVQQGNVASTQSVVVNDAEGLRALVEALLKAAGDLDLGEADRGVLDAAIATLKAQAISPSPSAGVVREIWHTVRHLGEGVVAHYIASHYADSVVAFLHQIGARL
jgi:hypothetical protein